MFVRFVIPSTIDVSDSRAGLFTVAYELRRSGDLPDYELEQLSEILDWFDDHLDAPDRFSRSKSKGAWRREARGISWLKADAHDHVQRMHALARMLQDHGHNVEMIRTARPGYIVYEDAYQIVAEPFSDTAV